MRRLGYRRASGRWWACLLALTALGVRPTRAQQLIPDSEAVRHPQDLITVEGVVHDVHISARSHVTYLNFGGAFPNISFSVHIPDSVAVRLPDLPTLTGARVRVSGRIWMQDERWPAITLGDTAQLRRTE